MIKGQKITLRPVQEPDLGRLYDFHQDIDNRGAYFPRGVRSEPLFRKSFHETGFWGKEEGMLLIIAGDGEIAGHIEWFPTVAYLDELELSYHIYSSEYRGQGIATEAVKLMTGYLFDNKKYNRIRLIIHPDNSASKRIAEKCGYKLEGAARGAWFHRGGNQDVEVYAILHHEYYDVGRGEN
jgi:RimJ/RimL family protein N-acetyltransferase